MNMNDNHNWERETSPEVHVAINGIRTEDPPAESVERFLAAATALPEAESQASPMDHAGTLNSGDRVPLRHQSAGLRLARPIGVAAALLIAVTTFIVVQSQHSGLGTGRPGGFPAAVDAAHLAGARTLSTTPTTPGCSPVMSFRTWRCGSAVIGRSSLPRIPTVFPGSKSRRMRSGSMTAAVIPFSAALWTPSATNTSRC